MSRLERDIFTLFKSKKHDSRYKKQDVNDTAYWTHAVYTEHQPLFNIPLGGNVVQKYKGLKEKSGWHIYLDYCTKQYNREIPLFLASCLDFDTQSSKQRSIQFFLNMYKVYIEGKSPMHINLPHPMQLEAARLFHKYSPTEESKEDPRKKKAETSSGVFDENGAAPKKKTVPKKLKGKLPKTNEEAKAPKEDKDKKNWTSNAPKKGKNIKDNSPKKDKKSTDE